MVETMFGIILFVLCMGTLSYLFIYSIGGKRDFPEWMTKPWRKKKNSKNTSKLIKKETDNHEMS